MIKIKKAIRKKYINIQANTREDIIKQNIGIMKSYNESAAARNLKNTSEVKYKKIIKLLNDRYNINL